MLTGVGSHYGLVHKQLDLSWLDDQSDDHPGTCLPGFRCRYASRAQVSAGGLGRPLETRVGSLRDRFVRPIGDLGTITLRSKRKEVDALIEAIRVDIERFRNTVVERLTREIDASRAKLVTGLTPALRKKPPQDLLDQVSRKLTPEHVTRYLSHRLAEVFPRAETLVGEMKLDCIRKGVTYETLASGDFQEKVRDAFPYKDWDKPFSEFTAAKAVQMSLPEQ
jgi:hypothetical protein